MLLPSLQACSVEDSLKLSSRLPMGRDSSTAAAAVGDYSKKVVLATLDLSWGAGTLQQQ